MPAAVPRFLSAGATHQGFVRPNNEDRIYCDATRGVFLVVDGMGGHEAGEQAAEIADKMIDLYSKAEVDAVYLAVNEFKNVMAANLVLRKILPVEVPEAKPDADKNAKQEGNKDNPEASIDYIYEQPPQELLSELLPRYVEMEIYRAMLESNSAEHAARMTAMDTASSNAGEVIQTLTLNMNRVRQAAITREIIEIVSGAAAL